MERPDSSIELLPHVAARVSQGAGCGSGPTFAPYWTFRRRAGHGTDRLFECSLTGRMIDLPTAAHEAYYYLQERTPGVESIEESSPFFDMGESMRLCAERGVLHPVAKGRPEPVTLDYLIRKRVDNTVKLFGRTLSAEAPDGDKASILDVLHELCRRHKIEWALVNPAPLDETLVASLRFARAWIPSRYRPRQANDALFAATFLQCHRTANTLKESIVRASAKLNSSSQVGVARFRYAAWTGSVPVDFTHPLALSKPLHLLPAE